MHHCFRSFVCTARLYEKGSKLYKDNRQKKKMKEVSSGFSATSQCGSVGFLHLNFSLKQLILQASRSIEMLWNMAGSILTSRLVTVESGDAWVVGCLGLFE